jgi:linear primary-alkylsulfatase
MMGVKSFMAQIADGTAQTEGNLDVLKKLASTMIDFDLFFEVLPGTKGPSSVPNLNDFELGPISDSHE